MNVEIVHLPRELTRAHIHGRTIVVLDVLRATTTMVAALDAGAKEIQIFASLDEARAAARGFAGAKLLCGETRCIRPDDFDLGNSPIEFTTEAVRGKTLFMSTTNGTKAIVAARGATQILVAGLVNAGATARYLREIPSDVTFLCAGTDGERSIEDEFGASTIIAMLRGQEMSQCDLRFGQGGKNLIAAGLEKDIDFASRIDCIDLVAKVEDHPLRVVRAG